MIEAFEQLNDFGWGNVVLIFLLMIVFVVAFLQSIHFIFEYFGIETKQTLKEKERDEEIKKLKEDIAKLQKSAEGFKNDRVHDREQSSQIQDNLLELIEQMTIKQEQIIERVDKLAECTRKYELADIRETLLQAYRYYTNPSLNPMRGWTAMEAHAFWEQYSNYEDRGGNGYMAGTVKPEMNKLMEIPLDDYEKVSALMESRHSQKSNER